MNLISQYAIVNSTTPIRFLSAPFVESDSQAANNSQAEATISTYNKRMETNSTIYLKHGDECKITEGTHADKTGTARHINSSKTGQVTITVGHKTGLQFKTLARN